MIWDDPISAAEIEQNRVLLDAVNAAIERHKPCAKCGRPRSPEPWPLKRPNLCSPKHWARCIR